MMNFLVIVDSVVMWMVIMKVCVDFNEFGVSCFVEWLDGCLVNVFFY